jgi:hypothetical protein
MSLISSNISKEKHIVSPKKNM